MQSTAAATNWSICLNSHLWAYESSQKKSNLFVNTFLFFSFEFFVLICFGFFYILPDLFATHLHLKNKNATGELCLTGDLVLHFFMTAEDKALRGGGRINEEWRQPIFYKGSSEDDS